MVLETSKHNLPTVVDGHDVGDKLERVSQLSHGHLLTERRNHYLIGSLDSLSTSISQSNEDEDESSRARNFDYLSLLDLPTSATSFTHRANRARVALLRLLVGWESYDNQVFIGQETQNIGQPDGDDFS